MSPEQAAGDADSTGAATSTAWPACCTRCSRASRRSPARRRRRSWPEQLIGAAAADLRTVRDTVPGRIGTRRAAGARARRPADRFPTAAAVRRRRWPRPRDDATRTGSGRRRSDVDRRAAVRQHERRPGERVLQRRDRRGDHQRAGQDRRAARRVAHLVVRASRARARTISRDRRRSSRSRTVLEGSVRKAGNRLRVTAQLINVADGYHLWSERYDREMTDVFAIQDEIAESDRRPAPGHPGADRGRALVTPATANLDAYHLYLKGRYCWAQRGLGLKQAVGLLQPGTRARPELRAGPRGPRRLPARCSRSTAWCRPT